MQHHAAGQKVKNAVTLGEAWAMGRRAGPSSALELFFVTFFSFKRKESK